MVSVNEISKSFGSKKVVNDITFKVKTGENLIILGTSGCGKTTTLKMINRLIEPDSGSISIDGKNIRAENKEILRRGIGYVMQNAGLFPHYTVKQNISVLPKILKWDSIKINERTNELINKLHLSEEILQKYPNQLSGGQQQRVGLARALIADTPLLLMDEPFGALDNVTRTELQKEFIALDEFKNKTIIMVTHDVQEAFELGDRVALMEDGKIIQIGTPQELLYHPLNNFVKQFFDGQRLALELKIILVADLWLYLDPINFIPEKILSSSKSMWEAMEILRKAENSAVYFISITNEKKAVTFESLTRAFKRYQLAQGNER